MAAFRFLAALFALVAILVFVADATPWLNGTGPMAATSFEAQWERLSPNTLKAAQNGSAHRSRQPLGRRSKPSCSVFLPGACSACLH